MYDDSSGYFYDPSTGLYYDGNSQYYYDSRTGQYLYWNAAKMTYSPAAGAAQLAAVAVASAAAAASAPVAEPAVPDPPEDSKKPDAKQDKIKVAKKIAKDMERWAKTLNQKKEVAKQTAAAEAGEAARAAASGSADIGFQVLEARAPAPPLAPPAGDDGGGLVPSYGSDSEGEEEPALDRVKLACLLCKRQFPSEEALDKHARLSDLHRRNLEARGEERREEIVYRDRAAERRLKYPRKFPAAERKPARVPSEPAPPAPVVGEIGEDNVGNRLLQKMGWSAGQGLGREGQGRVGPLEARAGPPGAGLGQKRGIYTAGPGETYRDCVKKLMIARYQDLVENETNP